MHMFQPLPESSNPACIVRPAETVDLADIVLLCGEHARYELADFDPVGKQDALNTAISQGRVTLWVAECASGLVGYASATREFSTWQAKDYLHLDCLYLRDAVRGQGIGARLVAAVKHYAAEQGINEMQWQTPMWNVKARRFYCRLGATETEKTRFRMAVGSDLDEDAT